MASQGYVITTLRHTYVDAFSSVDSLRKLEFLIYTSIGKTLPTKKLMNKRRYNYIYIVSK